MKKAKATAVTQATPTTKTNLKLIVGLGNPGPQYSETRHNAGFLVVDEIARRWGTSFKRPGFLKKGLAEEAKGKGLTLIKPLTFMNLSGSAVQAYATKGGLKPENVLLIHDDLDLPFGRLRFKVGGGAGGQKGVKDTAARIGPDFYRLKLGIGRPPERWTVENWVLSKFSKDEAELLERVVHTAADSVTFFVNEGLEPAMSKYNGVDLRPPTSLE